MPLHCGSDLMSEACAKPLLVVWDTLHEDRHQQPQPRPRLGARSTIRARRVALGPVRMRRRRARPHEKRWYPRRLPWVQAGQRAGTLRSHEPDACATVYNMRVAGRRARWTEIP